MKPNRAGIAWRLINITIFDVLNPLLLISLALFVSLGYILTLLMPVDISHWQALFWLALIAPLALLLPRARGAWHANDEEASRFTWRALLPLLPLLVLTPAFWTELTSATLQIQHHGDIHVGYIHQLIFEQTPIENVFIAGYPANYYWLYHAYLATIAKVTSFSPPSVSSLVNVIAICSSFIWIGKTLIMVGLGRSRTVVLGIMILLVYCSVNLTSTPTLIAHYVDGSYTPFAFDIMRLPGADERLHSVLGKVMNFTSVTLGIMTFSAAMYASVKLAKNQISLVTLVILSAAGIAALAVREIAAVYISIALLGALLAIPAFEWLRKPRKAAAAEEFWRGIIGKVTANQLGTWLALSLLLSIPLVNYNLEIVASFDSGRPFGLSSSNIRIIVAALLVLLPLFLLQFLLLWRKRDQAQTYIQASCFLALLLTTILTLPDGNQYKGMYFTGILMAVTALCAMRTLNGDRSRMRRRAGQVITTILFVLVLSQVAYVSLSYVNRASAFVQDGYRFVDNHVVHTQDIDQRLPAYLWIRDHTPPNALVLLPIIPSKYSNLFHERMLYVRLLQLHFKSSILVYNERVYDLELIYNKKTGTEEYRQLILGMENELPDRPFYAVIKDAEIEQAVMKQRGAILVFADESDGAHVYLLNPQ